VIAGAPVIDFPEMVFSNNLLLLNQK
jgi:hypothetical protein